jgi:putative endonuclease
MFYSYIIRSLSTGKLYKGSTNNIENRLWAHNAGLSPYTKGRGPWELIYFEAFQTRAEAMKREKFFKSGKGREYLKEKGVG